MLPLVIWGMMGAIGFLRYVARERADFGDTCERCGYSLLGLPAEGLCPECGAAYAGNGIELGVRCGWRLVVTRPWLLTYTFAGVLVVGLWPDVVGGSIARWIEAEVLIARGYRADVAWRAVTMPQQFRCGCGRHGGVLAPQAYVAALLPLVGRLPGRWAWGAAIAMSVVCAGGSIAFGLRRWLWT